MKLGSVQTLQIDWSGHLDKQWQGIKCYHHSTGEKRHFMGGYWVWCTEKPTFTWKSGKVCWEFCSWYSRLWAVDIRYGISTPSATGIKEIFLDLHHTTLFARWGSRWTFNRHVRTASRSSRHVNEITIQSIHCNWKPNIPRHVSEIKKLRTRSAH